MKEKIVFLLGVMLYLTNLSFGQTLLTVTGQVTEKATGEPVIGATIVILGQNVGTTTDVDGFYTLRNVPSDAVLKYNFIGLKPKEEAVAGRTVINVELKEETQWIDEVVVVGYGVQRKSDLTGAVGSIKSDDLQKISVANVANALQGRVSGVLVSPNGMPGNEPEVKIRGIGTTNNSSPLYVVDGMFVHDLGFLNNHDIASMEVLKDASATAIYGSRGANGVIIVTTKQGSRGKPVLTLSGSEGFQIVGDRLKMCTAEQYAQLLNEALVNTGGTPEYDHPELLGKGTNWFDEIFRVASVRDYQVALSGGSETVNYNLSVGFFQQKGVIKRNDYHRLSIRLNNEYRPVDKLSFGHNFSATFSLKKNDDASVVGQAYRLSPTITPYNAEGNFSDSENASTGNPLATLAYLNNHTRDNRLAGNVYLNWEVLEGLSFRTNFGIDYLNRKVRIFRPKYDVSSTQKNEQNELNKNWFHDFTWLWENTLTYNITLKEIHKLNLLGGVTAQERRYELLGGSGRDLFSQNNNYLYLDQTSKGTRSSTNNAYTESIFSYLFRANYTLMERYLFTFSFRADGSSKFGPDHRWGYFPSIAVGWRLSEENFLKGRFEWLDYLKIRGSWGQIGNDKIGNYKYYALANIDPSFDAVFDGIYYSGGTITSLYNRSVHWERSEQFDIGFDLGLLNNRLTFEFDFYHRKTKDMLVTVDVPAAVGLSPVETNVGTVTNRGVDFTFHWQHRVRDVNYAIRLTGTSIYNRVGRLGGMKIPKGDIGNGRLVSMTEAGKSIGYFYGYQVAGIFQSQDEINQYNARAAELSGNSGQQYQSNVAPGDLIYRDLDGNGYVNDQDRTDIGSPIPKFVGGLNLSMDWKGIDLSIDFQGNFGNKIFNAKQIERYSGSDNWDRTFLGRWREEYPDTDIPRMTFEGNNYFVSDRYVENGSYLKLQTLELGYTFPQRIIEKWQIKKLRVFFSGNNLFYVTKYHGFTPEVTGGALEAGIDRTIYPVVATYRFGLSITL